ncbi:MAG: hypothetical protein WAT93_11395 [Pontixanthobacter sp.]
MTLVDGQRAVRTKALVPRALAICFLIVACSTLAACGETKPAETAEEFSARIHANGPSPTDSPRPVVSQEPYEPVPRDGPDLAFCGGEDLTGFIGKKLSLETRKSLVASVAEGSLIRVLGPDSRAAFGEKAGRLNVLVDRSETIREFRCG